MTDNSTARSRRGELVLSLRGVSKHFGAVSALTDIELDVHAGEVVALVGDNGAGKSTLVKVLAGVHQPSTGTITFGGKEVTLSNPGAALDLGIATVFQDLALCENLDVVANIYLGRELFHRAAENTQRRSAETCSASRSFKNHWSLPRAASCRRASCMIGPSPASVRARRNMS